MTDPEMISVVECKSLESEGVDNLWCLVWAIFDRENSRNNVTKYNHTEFEVKKRCPQLRKVLVNKFHATYTQNAWNNNEQKTQGINIYTFATNRIDK